MILKQNKAITLVALVITIIILLILAGVSINLIFGADGIFTKSQYAVEKYKTAQKEEENILNEAKNYINDSFQLGYTRNSNINNYSTSEQTVGKWIDGKPLYQKTIDCGLLPVNTLKTIAVDAPGIYNVVSMSGIAIAGNETFPLPYLTDSKEWEIRIDYNSGDEKIRIKTYTEYWQTISSNAYVTIQYTKKKDYNIE